MGFFSDLKDDLSQAVNELMPEEELDSILAGEKKSEGKDSQNLKGGIITSEELSDMLDKVEAMSTENEVMNSESDFEMNAAGELPIQEEVLTDITVSEELPVEDALNEMLQTDEVLPKTDDEIVNDVQPVEEAVPEVTDSVMPDVTPVEDILPEEVISEAEPAVEGIDETTLINELETEEGVQTQAPEITESMEEIQAEMPDESAVTEPVKVDMPSEVINEFKEGVQEGMSEEIKEESMLTNELEQEKGDDSKMDNQPKVATDETAIVTEGMSIIGDVTSGGSLELLGSVTGNIDILGKLNITGSIQGNSKAAEIFAEGARINGEINSQGSVKIGQSSVIIGNIFANSAVIAGAVKGDIDIHGPVVLDTSAIVMGNIKSKSVQINNGAVIEGMCSQCYAEVNPTSFFEEIKKKKEK